MQKKKIIKLYMNTSSCPTQWEGVLNTGEFIYIRYRFGVISISVHLDRE